ERLPRWAVSATVDDKQVVPSPLAVRDESDSDTCCPPSLGGETKQRVQVAVMVRLGRAVVGGFLVVKQAARSGTAPLFSFLGVIEQTAAGGVVLGGGCMRGVLVMVIGR
ncbi:hypothetical protein Dimus_005807, partial [Dionaea muscipula]